MTNLTPQELAILDSISKPRKHIDLGTEINPSDNAEMYYYYNKSKSKSNSNSTLQQSTEPSAPADESVKAPPALFSSFSPSGPSVRDTKEVRKNTPRKVSLEDYYVQMNISINEVRRSKRIDRMNCYVSIREDNDKKFSIFLRSNLTTATHETFRLLREQNNNVLQDVLHQMIDECPSDAKFFCGRFKYNPRKWKLENEHKSTLRNALIGIYDYNTHMTCVIYILGEWYVIEADDSLTEKQKGFYDFTGSWERDVGEID